MQGAASAAALAPTVAAPRLLPALQLPPVAVGLYIALVYFGAMLSSQVGATLVRRWGPIRCSQASLASCAVGVLLVAVPHTGVAVMGALLVGVGYGPITPASSEMLARTTPPQRYAFVFSVKQTGVPLGGVLAGALMPVALLALYGATAIGGNGVYLATVARVVPQPQAAMATGGCLFFTYFGVVAGPPLFGTVAGVLQSLAAAFALLALPLGWTLWVLARSRRA